MAGTSPAERSSPACQIEATEAPLRSVLGRFTANVGSSWVLTSRCRTDRIYRHAGRNNHKIKDSGGTLASGSLGEVANPFRQVQYLVLRAQRYSAYDLVDLRLSAINLYAGQETEVESFESGDGTVEGETGAAEGEVDNHLSDASSMMVLYWTGWWPQLHFVASSESRGTLFHLKVDLLGNSEIVQADTFGAESQDFENALLFGEWAFVVGLQLFGLYLVCAAAERIPATGWWGVAAVILTMVLIAAYVWITACRLVENGIKSAGGMSFWFLQLSVAMICVAAGVKRVGSVAASAIMYFLKLIMHVPEGVEIKKGGIWTALVFVTMAAVFFFYYGHFYGLSTKV